MKFNKPCIDCGKLSRANRCPDCTKLRQKAKDSDPERRAKKAALYNTDYRKRRDLLKKYGGVCYLCGDVVPPGTGQADHIIPSDPNSPLALTHSFCNESKGNKLTLPQ